LQLSESVAFETEKTLQIVQSVLLTIFVREYTAFPFVPALLSCQDYQNQLLDVLKSEIGEH
jgi:hypothetical protein